MRGRTVLSIRCCRAGYGGGSGLTTSFGLGEGQCITEAANTAHSGRDDAAGPRSRSVEICKVPCLRIGALNLVNKWVLLSYRVVAMFDNEQAKCQNQSECGGILVGAYRGPYLEVSNFTEPGPKDLRQPYTFVKQDPSHQRSATKAWKRSGGKDTYVGEWH